MKVNQQGGCGDIAYDFKDFIPPQNQFLLTPMVGTPADLNFNVGTYIILYFGTKASLPHTHTSLNPHKSHI